MKSCCCLSCSASSFPGFMLVAAFVLISCVSGTDTAIMDRKELTYVLPRIETGPFEVGSTNFEINLPTNQTVEWYMQGAYSNGIRYDISNLIRYRNDAFYRTIQVPNQYTHYRSAAGVSLTYSAYVFYPTTAGNNRSDYTFPYSNTNDNVFPHMQQPGQAPIFADENQQYPVIISAHGYSAHGLYDVGHCKLLASQGYIVISLFFADYRYRTDYYSLRALRPLVVREFLTTLFNHPGFQGHIDQQNIGITGHSLGGFTVLACLGGQVGWSSVSTLEPRIKAGVGVVPSMGNGSVPYHFSSDYSGLTSVDKPFIAIYGEVDPTVRPAEVNQGIRKVNGTAYAVEMAGQGHIFVGDAWAKSESWEITFFSAYLQGNGDALRQLRQARHAIDQTSNCKTFQKLVDEPPLSHFEAFGECPASQSHPAVLSFNRNEGGDWRLQVRVQTVNDSNLGLTYSLEESRNLIVWNQVQPAVRSLSSGEYPWQPTMGYLWQEWNYTVFDDSVSNTFYRLKAHF